MIVKTPKRLIGKDTYLKAYALFTMAHNHYMRCREFEAELSQLLGYENQYMNCLSDELYEPRGSFDEGLKNENISVRGKR